MIEAAVVTILVGLLTDWLRHAPARRLTKLADRLSPTYSSRLREEWLAAIGHSGVIDRWRFAIGIGLGFRQGKFDALMKPAEEESTPDFSTSKTTRYTYRWQYLQQMLDEKQVELFEAYVSELGIESTDDKADLVKAIANGPRFVHEFLASRDARIKNKK